MAVSVSDISSKIDRQIEEFLSQITEEQYQDFLNNSTQLLPKLDGSIDSGPKSLDGSSSTTTTAASSSKISPSSRFAAPKDDEAVLAAQKSAIPETTKKSTADWACRIWEQWSLSRKQSDCSYPPPPHLCSDKSTLDSWLSKFLLEIRRQDGKEYPPNTLYCIACGI